MHLQSPIQYLSAFWRQTCLQYPPGLIVAVGNCVALTIGFLIPATVYLILDQFTYFSSQRKIQPWEKQPTASEVRRCAIFAVFTFSYSCAASLVVNRLLGWRFSSYEIIMELPSLHRITAELLYAVLFREFLFYYIHRLLHNRYFFWIHRKHHEIVTPTAFGVFYCHPIEMIVQNILPVSLPLALCRGHYVTQWLFATYAILSATSVHSGYDFVCLPSARKHDLHHEKFFQHYGLLGIMDRLHGTDKKRLPPKSAPKKTTPGL